MLIYVIADAVGNDLYYRFASETMPVSCLYKQPGKASRIGGNPYLIYGPDIKKWLPSNAGEYSAVVATMASGRLADDGDGPDDTDKAGY